ncbi:peptide ABC transporter substrate-binding protein [Teredinibacter franksiae]|uniref:peptide ABC transporter substrate-binding protein n=1 Tax=Teredinibacter franksiae TaxID=2761453 RepID=UPI0016235FEB|nr:peptide ABC transporter substrate-binding protein [Teredinibacter franksiae]
MAIGKIVESTQLLLIITGLTLLFSSCSPSNTSKHNPEQTLHVSIGAAPQALDPHLIVGVPAMKVVAALFETLLTMDAQSNQPAPGLAHTWHMGDGGLTYRFILRDELKWSDGSPITADDIVVTWQRIFAANIGHPFAQDYYAIAGAKAYHLGEHRDFTRVGVKALDRQTVEFKLKAPDPLFLKRLTHASTSPIQKANLLAFTELDNPVSAWTQGKNLVGNGPFRLVDWQLNKMIVVEKNPHYWDAQNVKLEKIVFYPIENMATEERMFRSGKVQLLYGGKIPQEKIQTYQKESPEKLVIVQGYATYYYNFNTLRAPFDNVNVRRAFTYAVDRDSIIQRIAKAGQTPALTLSPKDRLYSPDSPIRFAPKLAQQYLADAGYPNGDGFPPVTLTFNTDAGHRKVSVALQQMWKKHLNIDVQLDNQEWKVFLSNRRQHVFDISRDGSSSTFADPMDMLNSFTSAHVMNTAGWSNAEYDRLLASARTELNVETRLALLEKAEIIFTREVPVFPIYYYAYSYLIAPEVKGMEFNSIEVPNYKSIYIDYSAREK